MPGPITSARSATRRSTHARGSWYMGVEQRGQAAGTPALRGRRGRVPATLRRDRRRGLSRLRLSAKIPSGRGRRGRTCPALVREATPSVGVDGWPGAGGCRSGGRVLYGAPASPAAPGACLALRAVRRRTRRRVRRERVRLPRGAEVGRVLALHAPEQPDRRLAGRLRVPAPARRGERGRPARGDRWGRLPRADGLLHRCVHDS